MLHRIFKALAVVVGIASLGPWHAAAAGDALSFGVLSQRSAVLTAQYWNPVLEYVKAKTGTALALKVARTAPESNESIKAGGYDFVYSNTIFQPAMADAGYRVILRPRTEAIASHIVTLEDSPITSLKDLDGKVVGFPSLAAFVGYAVPLDHLMREGISVTPVFGGHQEGIMGQLKVGKVIAAAGNSQV
ncbi:MAG: PhnD/SsuA/transferrin family substrate-binding protein, partial [Alphaproteobacteria bacterium]|nr:PhnD/SsuA/transferrin family substrate-binding protein [Alphaproteobacteria bacterium]